MRLDSLMKLRGRILFAAMSFALGLGLGVNKPPLAASGSSERGALPEIIFVITPKVVAGDLTKRFPQGSRLERLAPGKPNPSEVNLTREFLAAADPQVSAEGTQVLFSGKERADSHWQVWEMNADGSHKRQITSCPGDCLRPAYLPRNQVVYTAIDGEGAQRTSALIVAQGNGADAHPITFGPGNFQVETVLRDGRILISAKPSLVPNGAGDDSRALYTIRPDGTGLTLFRSDPRPNFLRTEAEELDDGSVLFVKRRNGPPSHETGGEVAWIRPGALHNSLVTPRQSVYWSAHKLQGTTLVVARTGSGSSAGNAKFDLYTFDLASKTVGKLIYHNPKLSSIQAVPLAPHPSPRYYWSILHPQAKTGRVICLNSYLSADARQGRMTAPIARVRVIMLEPDHHRERILGEAPVEKDGSFYIQVPADRAMRFELLGPKGRLIKAQRSWVWARTGEDMGCAGCHDDKAQAPPNHWPLALNRFDTPIALGEPPSAQATGH
jgi:Hydrazine synthase alpha subunit middle domain